MQIHIATDHAGFEMKEFLAQELTRLGYEVKDHGAYEYEEDDDYPDYIAQVARTISDEWQKPEDEHERPFGIILGGSGQGEAIVANRFPFVRAVVFNGQYMRDDGVETPDEIMIARQHNDANILSLGARFLSHEDALAAVEQFLTTSFSHEDRHVRRIEKIDSLSF